MRRVVLVLFALALPTVASATSIEYGFSGNLSTTTSVSGMSAADFGSLVFVNSSTSRVSGDFDVNVVPEPGTLGLLSTGLIGLAGIVRRKMRS